jgi:hypothetical protein
MSMCTTRFKISFILYVHVYISINLCLFFFVCFNNSCSKMMKGSEFISEKLIHFLKNYCENELINELLLENKNFYFLKKFVGMFFYFLF